MGTSSISGTSSAKGALPGPRHVVRLERDRLGEHRSHQRRGLGLAVKADGDVDDVAEAGGGKLVGGLGLVPAVGDQQDLSGSPAPCRRSRWTR